MKAIAAVAIGLAGAGAYSMFGDAEWAPWNEAQGADRFTDAIFEARRGPLRITVTENGYLKAEFDALGIPFERKGPRTDDYLEAIRSLWADERPEHRGEFVQFEGIQAMPRPVQRPHPPIVVGGMSAGAYRRAVERGDGWYGFALDVEVQHEISTSLARPDYFNWPARLQEIDTDLDPEAVVLFIGANDHQDMADSDGNRLVEGTPEWGAEWQRRLAITFDLLEQDGRHLFWVTQPPMRDGALDDGIDEINALAESSDGFVWRYIEGDDEPKFLMLGDEEVLFNMSTWESIEQLEEFTYRTRHANLLRDRGRWFHTPDRAPMVLWWQPRATIPTPWRRRRWPHPPMRSCSYR